MKKGTYLLSCVFMMFGCHSKADVVRTFMPGTYVRFSDHEMRTEYDTLRIERLSKESNVYHIHKSSTFQKKWNGHKFPWESTKKSWTALYDVNDNVLKDNGYGKVISFIPEKNTLFLGSTKYKKIK